MMSDHNSEISASLATLTTSVGMMHKTLERVVDKTDELGKSVSRVDVKSAAAREQMTKDIADNLSKNRDAIHESNKMSQVAHEALREELRASAKETFDATKGLILGLETEVDEIGDRITEVEKSQASTKVRDATIVTTVGTGFAALGIFFSESFKKAISAMFGG